MNEGYLPIGTVVTLKKFPKKVVIVGFAAIKDREYFDYCGYPYPEGFSGDDKNIVFERTMIEKIEYMGYQTVTQRTMAANIEEVMNKFNEGL